jgi:acetyl-CoA decarbonylase/synthase complex subunit gamma
LGLSGLDIYKKLPKTNCGECGPPTCLAFAMALAAGKTHSGLCPHLSAEAREFLASASAPPIRPVTVGAGPLAVQLGNETVLYRHEKRFEHPTGIFVEVGDDRDDAETAARSEKLATMRFSRVGQEYRLDGCFLRYASGDPARFAALARRAQAVFPGAFILGGEAAGLEPALARALEVLGNARPLLYAATPDNYPALAALARQHGCPLVLRGEGLEGTAGLARLVAPSHPELVLDTGARGVLPAITDLTHIRRLAIKKKFRPLGYPALAFTTAPDPGDEMVEAAALLAKYAAIVVVKSAEAAGLLALLTWRENLYTDPQKPIQVKSQLYEVGPVTAASPVYVTTNFSLTYFSVAGEVQASQLPGYILVVDTGGTSVLTAWAAGKLTPESIADTMRESGLVDKVNHRRLVLPGHVAVLSGRLQELTGWQVLVGPREAAGIPAFARKRFA